MVMVRWQELRRILTLLCIATILLAAVFPGDPGLLAAALGPVWAIAVPNLCPAQRMGAGAVHADLPAFLGANADRAPPVPLMGLS